MVLGPNKLKMKKKDVKKEESSGDELQLGWQAKKRSSFYQDQEALLVESTPISGLSIKNRP